MMERAAELLHMGMDKALAMNRAVIVAHIRRLRRTRPDASPAELLKALERHYLATVTAGGAVAGGVAAVPAVGTGAGLVVNLAEIPVFIEATALFALAQAEIHGVRIDDLERRRTLVYAVLLGNGGGRVVEQIADRTGRHWAKLRVSKIDINTIRAINKVLGRNFVTKFGTKEGILVLGREIPLGIGAGIGAAGNAGFGYVSVRAARRAFGAAPVAFPGTLTVNPDPDLDPSESFDAPSVTHDEPTEPAE